MCFIEYQHLLKKYIYTTTAANWKFSPEIRFDLLQTRRQNFVFLWHFNNSITHNNRIRFDYNSSWIHQQPIIHTHTHRSINNRPDQSIQCTHTNCIIEQEQQTASPSQPIQADSRLLQFFVLFLFYYLLYIQPNSTYRYNSCFLLLHLLQ